MSSVASLPRTPEDANRKRKRADNGNDSDNEDEQAVSTVVSEFIETYLVKKVGVALRLSSLRLLIEEVMSTKLHKQSPILMRCINEHVTASKLSAGEVKMMAKNKTLPAQYRVESKSRGTQDVKVFGVTLRNKAIAAWKQEGHAKYALYNRVRQATKPTFRDADLQTVLASITQDQSTDASQIEEQKPARVTFPVTTPGAPDEGFHVTLIEGLFTRVNYRVSCTTVDLECIRVVPEGSSVPSGVYPLTDVLEGTIDDQKPVQCRQLQLGVWQVKVPLARPAAGAGEGVAGNDMDEEYRKIMGIILKPDVEEPQQTALQALLVEDGIEDL